MDTKWIVTRYFKEIYIFYIILIIYIYIHFFQITCVFLWLFPVCVLVTLHCCRNWSHWVSVILPEAFFSASLFVHQCLEV